jgi:hypothetical protein
LRDRADTENARLAAGMREAVLASSGSLAREEEDSCLEEMRPEAEASWRRVRAADILGGGRKFENFGLA